MSRDRAAGPPTLLAALRRHPALVVTSGIAVGLLGAGIGLSLPVAYEATSHVVVSLPGQVVGSGEGGEEPEETAQRAAQAMIGVAVLRSAGERVPGRPGPQAVAAALTVVPSEDSGVVSVTATGSTPAAATALADAVGESYLEVAAAETVARHARRIERLDLERQNIEAQLGQVWGSFAQRAARLRATAGPVSTVSAVVGSDFQLEQLRENGGRLAQRLSAVERSIVAAEASTALAPIERQELVRADDPASARGAMLRRSAALAVPLGLLLGAGLAWRRVDREGTTSPHPAPGFRFLGRLPAARAGAGRPADTGAVGLWRQLRLVAEARHLDDLVVVELPPLRRSRRAAQRLLEAAGADGCVVRDDLIGSRGLDRAVADGSHLPGTGPLRVVRATSTAVLSTVLDARHTGVVVVGPLSASFDRDVRAVETSVRAAGGDFLGVLVVGGRTRARVGPRAAALVHRTRRLVAVAPSEQR